MINSTRLREFGSDGPRALVFDDNKPVRDATARRFRSAGFQVESCGTREEFYAIWAPGTFDVIVADWNLAADYKGDDILAGVREKDWDVPFVLVSGRLAEDSKRTGVLDHLLAGGSARFVERGDDGIEQALDAACRLIERKDLALLRSILKFRNAIRSHGEIATTSGSVKVKDLLAEIVRNPGASDDADGPTAAKIASRIGSLE